MSEDPNLLNPPPPDSTGIRIVNLLERDPISVSFPGIPIAANLSPLEVAPLRNVLILEQTLLLINRQSKPTPDTLFNQTLARGDSVDYIVLGTDTTISVLRLGTGDQERADLARRKERKVSFINAVNDGATYYVKSGCQSGDQLFAPSYFAQAPQSIVSTADELSLYLFSSADSSRPVASARLPLVQGGTPLYSTQLIAARRNGVVKLYVLGETGSGTLQEAPPETRNTAEVELLNALDGGRSVSATTSSGQPIATGLAPLQVSAPSTVEACANPLGDSLEITASGGAQFKVPIRLTVGARALVVVYNTGDNTRALVLERPMNVVSDGKAHLRGVNVSSRLAQASISIGAGAPQQIDADSRPFGTLSLSATSDYATLPPGSYPLMLSDATTGGYLNGGIQNLPPGYYTVVVATDADAPALFVIRDDMAGSPLAPIDQQGSRAIFFNMMADVDATFTIGGLSPRSLAYSYVYSTVVPYTIQDIISNAGNVRIDPALGSYMIGATGSAGNHSILSFRTSTVPLGPGKAGVRFINAVPGSPSLTVHIDSAANPAMDTLTFGTPSIAREFDERQYSVAIKAAGDSLVLARTNGVRLSKGRRYLLVVGPKRDGSTSTLTYQTLWIQE